MSGKADCQRYNPIPIWDPWIRIFHWSLAVSVIFMLLTGWIGLERSQLFRCFHDDIGQVIAALVIFRILWGLIGSSNVRLSALFQNPLTAAHHLRGLLYQRNVQQERGHNAAGSWAVLLMLALLGFQAASGYLISDTDNGDVTGPLFYTYSIDSELPSFIHGLTRGELSDWLLELHFRNADILTTLAVVHVVMVFLYLILVKQNLIGPMVTGKMRWKSTSAAPDLRLSSTLRGFVLAIVVISFVGWVGDWHKGKFLKGALTMCVSEESEFDF